VHAEPQGSAAEHAKDDAAEPAPQSSAARAREMTVGLRKAIEVGGPTDAARNAPIRQLLLELPALVVTDALAHHDKTTTRLLNETCAGHGGDTLRGSRKVARTGFGRNAL
jgi:hypothetical protein